MIVILCNDIGETVNFFKWLNSIMVMGEITNHETLVQILFQSDIFDDC